MEGIPFSSRCLNDLFTNNFKMSPPDAKEMQKHILSGAVALGIDDPYFWDFAKSMQNDLRRAINEQ